MQLLNNIIVTRPVIIEAYSSEGINSIPLDIDPLYFNSAQDFIEILNNDQLALIEADLQSLCKSEGGTEFLTAHLNITEFYEISDIRNWADLGCNTIVIHFEKLHHR
jgi:hypothetical protein